MIIVKDHRYGFNSMEFILWIPLYGRIAKWLVIHASCKGLSEHFFSEQDLRMKLDLENMVMFGGYRNDIIVYRSESSMPIEQIAIHNHMQITM